jgi:hypothetical protein
LFLLALYLYQTSDGERWIVHILRARNDSLANFTTTSATADYSTEINYSSPINISLSSLTDDRPDYYNIWCIFTKVASNSPMRRKFQIFTDSLLRLATVDIIFHVISDDDSQSIAQTVIQDVMDNTGKFMQVYYPFFCSFTAYIYYLRIKPVFSAIQNKLCQTGFLHLQIFYYDVHKLAAQLEDIISVMSPHFSSKPGTYYSDALFFLSLGLHRIAPSHQKLAAMFDADTKFHRDVKDLFKEFDNFGKQALFGLAPELTPVYRHVLYLYRNKHPTTMFGEPRHKGGYPGYNSGMVLFNLERLRESHVYNEIVSKDSVDAMTEKYHFKVNYSEI